MEQYFFQKAKAIWKQRKEDQYNQFLGFFTELQVGKPQEIRFAIAARSYYRLYINGEMCANGPARTAKGYCRVDELKATLSGTVKVAVEVLALDKPGKYCNDCTLEPGMLIVEILRKDGSALSATGQGAGEWKCRELPYRRMEVETMSHSRGIVEWYDMEEDSLCWMNGVVEDFELPEVLDTVENPVTYLKRRAPYPKYERQEFEVLQKVNDRVLDPDGKAGLVLQLSRMKNQKWYEQIPKENFFLEKVCKEKDSSFTGKYQLTQNGRKKQIEIQTGKNDAAVIWGLRESELGFLEFYVEAEEDCVIDVVNSDHLNVRGELKANTYVTRYCLKKGAYHLITTEPKLTRYVKLIIRTQGRVRVTYPALITYTYPDDKECWFECNDGDLNRIYDASRKTLRLNTLDIFMDCPQRERGGWLCDSQFTAYGAWQMFGDLSVEKDFIENFMLTNPDELDHALFPEVYPSSKESPEDVGIMNWSFWLITELFDYYERSGDDAFIEICKERVERFVEGVLSFRGESGLLENMKVQFVDWSLSNRDFCLQPISVPNNCFAVCMVEKAAQLYGRSDWEHAAKEMRIILEKMDELPGLFGGGGDGAVYEKGSLRRTDCSTESGIALELWSGFHRYDRGYVRRFVDTMGYSPRFCPNPNVGKANLFIGLMIRFSVLEQLGEYNQLIQEIKDLYLPELRIGSGTLFENYSGFSGCHGFNAAIGAYLTNYILGLGEPKQKMKTVRICPNPGDLFWACGSAKCEDGDIRMNWNADHVEHRLEISLLLPEGWKAEYDFPFELSGWKIYVNGIIQDLQS